MERINGIKVYEVIAERRLHIIILHQNPTFNKINLFILVLFSSMTLILDLTSSLQEERRNDVEDKDKTTGCIHNTLRA